MLAVEIITEWVMNILIRDNNWMFSTLLFLAIFVLRIEISCTTAVMYIILKPNINFVYKSDGHF